MSEQYQINLFQGRDLVVVSKEGAREIKMTIRQAATALVSHEALVVALEKSLAAINEQIHAETNRGNERIEQRAADLISEARQLGRAALAAAKE